MFKRDGTECENDLAATASAAVTTTMAATAVIKFMLFWNLSLPCKRSHVLKKMEHNVTTTSWPLFCMSSTCWPRVAGVICHNWKNSTWVLACGKTNFFSLCCGNKCPSVVSCTLVHVKFDSSHGVDGPLATCVIGAGHNFEGSSSLLTCRNWCIVSWSRQYPCHCSEWTRIVMKQLVKVVGPSCLMGHSRSVCVREQSTGTG